MTIHYKKYIGSRWFHIAIIAIVCILTYLPILSHSYAVDDIKFFQEWKTPRSFTNTMKFLEGDVPPDHEGVYRPLRTFIYAVDYKLWGDNPVGYHAQAIVVNSAAAVLVYLIAAALTGSSLTAFVTGLLFGLHPVHTEAVTFTTASMDTIGLAVALASFYLYISSKRTGSWRFYVSLALAIAAFFIYEVTLVLPVLILAYHICFNKQKKQNSIPVSLVWYFIAIIYYVVMRLILINQSPTRPIGYFGGSFFMNMVLISKFFYLYVYKLVIPVNLSFFYEVAPGINTYEVSQKALQSMSIIDLNNLITLAIVIVSLIAAVYYFHKKPVITFSILWFYIAMIPVVNIMPTHSMFAERYVYFSSFGFLLILGLILSQTKFRLKYALILLIAGWYIFATIHRNADWQDNITIWTHVTRVAPQVPYGWNNVGAEYDKRGDKQKALWYYKKALSVDPHYANALNNIGTLYTDNHEYIKAIPYYEEAVAYDPYSRNFSLNLLMARQKLNEQNSVRYTPAQQKEIDAIIAKERSLVMSGFTKEALSVLEAGLTKFKDDPSLLNDAAVVRMSKGNYKKAVEYLTRAINARPADPDLYLNLANAYQAAGDKQKAVQAAQMALHLKPELREARTLLDSLKQ